MPTNKERAERAQQSVQYYRDNFHGYEREPDAEIITDILSDLMHYCDESDPHVSFDDCLRMASMHHESEVLEPEEDNAGPSYPAQLKADPTCASTTGKGEGADFFSAFDKGDIVEVHPDASPRNPLSPRRGFRGTVAYIYSDYMTVIDGSGNAWVVGEGEAKPVTFDDDEPSKPDLLNAAVQVVAAWESGDLAKAVRNLNAAIKGT